VCIQLCYAHLLQAGGECGRNRRHQRRVASLPRRNCLYMHCLASVVIFRHQRVDKLRCIQGPFPQIPHVTPPGQSFSHRPHPRILPRLALGLAVFFVCTRPDSSRKTRAMQRAQCRSRHAPENSNRGQAQAEGPLQLARCMTSYIQHRPGSGAPSGGRVFLSLPSGGDVNLLP